MILNSQKKILICILVILAELFVLCQNAGAVVCDLTNIPDFVDAKFQGNSNSTAIFYNIQNNSDSPVSIGFKAGNSFFKNSGGFQDLVLSESGKINVPPNSRVSGKLNALCVNKGIPTPSSGAGSLTPVTKIYTISPALQRLISDFICDVEKHEKETGLKLPFDCKQSVIHLIVFQNDHQRELSYAFPYLDTNTLKALISELNTLMHKTTRSDLLDDEYQLGEIYQTETKKIAEKYFKTDVELKRFYSLWIRSFRSVLYELIYAYRENKYHPFQDIIKRTLDRARSITGSRRYKTKTGDRVTLNDSIWEEILLKMPNARAYEGNIKETLENPDFTIKENGSNKDKISDNEIVAKGKHAGSSGGGGGGGGRPPDDDSDGDNGDGGGGPPPPGGPGNDYDDYDDDDDDREDDKETSITVDDPISRLADNFFKLYPDSKYNFGDDNELSRTFVKYFKKFTDLLGGKFFSVVVYDGQVVDIAISDRPVKNNPNYYCNLSRIAAMKPDRDENKEKRDHLEKGMKKALNENRLKPGWYKVYNKMAPFEWGGIHPGWTFGKEINAAFAHVNLVRVDDNGNVIDVHGFYGDGLSGVDSNAATELFPELNEPIIYAEIIEGVSDYSMSRALKMLRKPGCRYEPGVQHSSPLVWGSLWGWRTKGYFLLGNQCQNFATDVSKLARKLDLDPFTDEEPIAVLKDTIKSASKDALKYIKNKAGELIALPQRVENVFRESMKDVFADVFQFVGCSVNTVLREYNDESLDLSVKVPGGEIVVKRLLYANSWHWEHVRHNLRFVSRERVKIESIEKGGVIYDLTNSSNSQGTKEYIHGTYKIIETETGYQWKDKFGNWKKYSLNGNMTSYGNRTGVIGKLIYDEKTKLVAVADRNEKKVIWFDYNNLGQISGVHDSANRRVMYSYADGRLINVKDVLQNEISYAYDSNGKLSGSTDAAGWLTTVSYDSYDNVSHVVDRYGKGHFFRYSYDEASHEYYAKIKTSSNMVKEVWYDLDGETKRVDINGRTIKKIVKDGLNLLITDEKGNITRKEFDEWENLTRVVYPDRSEVSFEYEHSFNKLVGMTDLKGNTAKYIYDGNGNLIQKSEAVGTDAERMTTFTYDEYGQLLTATVEGDANTQNATMTLVYHGNGNLASITDPERNTTEFLSYDTMGNLLEMKDPRGHTWTFAYDNMGRLISQTDPGDNKTVYEYDGANNRTAIINAAMKRFEFEYDDHNNFVRFKDPYKEYFASEYNTDNLPTLTIGREGKETRFEYDNEGRLLKTVDGVSNEISYHYDETLQTPASSHKPVRIDYPTYTSRTYYDRLQRVIRQSDFLNNNTSYSTRYTYDSAGNVVSVTDAEENTTLYEYDALNRLVKTTDSLEGITKRTYDDRGNVIAVKDPNNGTTSYEYDRNNRLEKVIRPMGEETSYKYDAAGNRTFVLDANGQKIEYAHDSLSRLTGIRYYDSVNHTVPVKTVTFTYDRVGNLASYNDGTTSATYTYDDLQRKTDERVDYGPFSLSYAYSYYDNGLKESFTFSDETTYYYIYDANNRLNSIAIPEHGQITYNTYQWNAPSKITLPGGNTKNYTYDPLMQITSITMKDNGQRPLMDYRYAYSPAGNITSKNTDYGNHTYKYDKLYRLTEASNPTIYDELYTYDLLDNRLTSAGVEGSWVYNRNNELLGYKNVTFAYDDNGNMIRKAVNGRELNFIYNIEDRIARVEDGSGSAIAEYYYDPFGRRLWKNTGGTKTYFFYADEGLVGEYDENGHEIRAYGYAPDSTWTTNPLFQKKGTDYYWYQNNHMGTPQKIIDTSGAVVWTAAYDSFGNIRIAMDGIENNLRFPGQYYDAETGLYYNWNRYYDPTIGRYITTDPYEEGLNLYAYVFGNPVVLMDPEGLCALRIFGGFSEIIVGSLLIPGTGGLGTAVGIVLILNGFDNLIAGGSSLGSGEYKMALLETIVYKLVPNKTAAGFIYAGSQILIPYGCLKIAQFDKARIAAQAAGKVSGASRSTFFKGRQSLGAAASNTRTGLKGLLKDAGLPIRGKVRFIPEKNALNTGIRVKDGGFVDKFGNVWRRPRGQIVGEPHWDVQLSRTGQQHFGRASRSGHHINVSLDGRIVH